MSNPVTNRWGLNLFWYKWWYNDKISTLLYHQDILIERIVYTYINYGTTHTKNTFTSHYWTPLSFAKIKNFANVYMTKVTRYVERVHQTFNEKNTRKARVKPSALYNSKIWILRFQNWLILNFYFFQPLKKFKIEKNKNIKSSTTLLKYTSKIHLKMLLRQKLILFYFFKNVVAPLYYFF